VRRRVVVTGIGAVSPLGLTAESSWEAAVAGRSGIRTIDFYDATPLKTRIAGVVDAFDLSSIVTPRVPVPPDNRRVRFAMAAAEMAVRDSGIDLSRLDPRRAGVSLGSNESHFQPEELGLPFTAAFDGATFHESTIGNWILEHEDPTKLLFQESQQIPSLVSIHYGTEGPTTSFLTACAAGSQALGEALRMIRRGAVDVCLAGGADSMFSPIKIVGFGSLGALSKRNDEPERASRPFDAYRDGFVLGEGAGVLVLEELEHARARGAKIYAEVAGYGVGLEIFHLTAMSPDAAGPTAAIRRALDDAGIRPEEVGYVNAHGTSTIENDAAETRAIRNAFGEHAARLAVSSTKSMTGHLVAGAGAIEAVFSIFALRDQTAPPTINYETPDPECDLDYVPNRARAIETDYAISNSFGFGGQNVTLVLRRWREGE
jgi:3-oxoacyl-[acyl-carrier-protein] synthase II